MCIRDRIIIADIEDLRGLLEKKSVTKHKWKKDVDETDYHMLYGYDNMDGEQYSILCKVDKDIIPGKISNGKATYTEGFDVKECLEWRFVEGRLVHETDFSSVKCRKPLGKMGDKRYYNGVVHLRNGYVVGKVDASLNLFEFSRDDQVQVRRNNFYVIC